MPLYTWVDEITDYEIDILRNFDGYQDPPADEDLPLEERGKQRSWKRLITGKVTVRKPAGWGSKGNW